MVLRDDLVGRWPFKENYIKVNVSIKGPRSQDRHASPLPPDRVMAMQVLSQCLYAMQCTVVGSYDPRTRVDI